MKKQLNRASLHNAVIEMHERRLSKDRPLLEDLNNRRMTLGLNDLVRRRYLKDIVTLSENLIAHVRAL